jgi:hypothetical protein
MVGESNHHTHAASVQAMARYLTVLVYRTLTKNQAWVDRGAATGIVRSRADRFPDHRGEVSGEPGW